jgi:hypothetical protein
LLYPPQALIKRMSHDLQQKVVVQRNKAVYGVIDDLS